MTASTSESKAVLRLVELAELQLDELRVLRREAELQRELLELILERLGSLEPDAVLLRRVTFSW